MKPTPPIVGFVVRALIVAYIADWIAPKLRPRVDVMFHGVSMNGNGSPGPMVEIRGAGL